MKRLLWIGAAMIVVVLGLWIFNYFYYFPPKLPQARIIELAEEQLEKELPSYMRKYSDPYMKTELHKLKILDVQKLGQKTYLVFKADVDRSGEKAGYEGFFQAGTYMLGIRLVEGKPGGIVLKDGMEFTTEMISGPNPVECGLMPDGIFYGFCKDPRVDRVEVEMGDGNRIKAEIHNRVILAQIPKDQTGRITLWFYDKEGMEIEQSWGMKIAFVSQDEKFYRQYSNYPLDWWNMTADEIDVLSPGMVNAIWVFPDQQQKSLEKERAAKLTELVKAGIPVIFVGMKDLQQLEVLGIEQKNILNAEVPVSEIEAIYLATNEQKGLQAGVITLEEEQGSPVLMKTVNLRYQLDLSAQAKNKSADAINEKAETAIPRPATTVVKDTVTGGGRN